MYIYIGADRMHLVPTRELGRVGVRVARRVHERTRHDRAAALERRADRVQLLRLEPELGLEVVQRRRSGRGEVPEQERPVFGSSLHPRELRARDRVDQPRDILRDEQVLAAVDLENEVAALPELPEPRELRPRPLPET